MLDVIMNDILGTPAILVGLFAFVGLLIQKKINFNSTFWYVKNGYGFCDTWRRCKRFNWFLKSF